MGPLLNLKLMPETQSDAWKPHSDKSRVDNCKNDELINMRLN